MNSFVYYGLYSPTPNSTRIFHVRFMGIKIVYMTVTHNTKLDKVLTKIVGEPEY